MIHNMNMHKGHGDVEGMVSNIAGWRETEDPQSEKDMKIGGFRAHHGTNMGNEQRILKKCRKTSTS